MRVRSWVMPVLLVLLAGCSRSGSQSTSGGTGAPVDVEAARAAAKAVIDRLPQAMMNKDTTAVSEIFAHDPEMVVFGTDSTEHWIGFDAVEQGMNAEIVAFTNTKIDVRDQKIEIDPAGDVAWFSQIMDWDFDMGGQHVHAPGVRATGVVVQRDGAWKMEQFHGSLPAGGTSPPAH